MESGQLPHRLQETLAIFDDDGEPLTTPEVTESLDVGRRSTYTRLEELVEFGRIQTKKVGANARVWWQPAGSGSSTYGPTTEERFRELERYKTTVETVDDGIYALDANERIVMVNQAMCEITGYDRDELLGAHPTIHTATIDNEAFNEASTRIIDGERDTDSIELEIQRSDGQTRDVECRFTNYDPEGGKEARCGVVRDITERKTRERELEESRRRYRTLVNNFPNGVVGLFDKDLRYQIIGGEGFEGKGNNSAELEGTRMPDQVPEELRRQVEPSYRAVFDGEKSEIRVEFNNQIRRLHVLPVRDDSGEVFAGIAVSQDITEQVEHEHELNHRRQHLNALNNLNEVVQETTTAVIEQSTREEIEEIVCERLAESNSYTFAWIGGVDTHSQTVTLRTEAGVEGYLDGVTVSVDPTDERSQGPTGQAVLEEEVQITNDVNTDPNLDPWRDHFDEQDFRSSAAIPIGHEGTLYGILRVYAERPHAFGQGEREMLRRLGEVVGHAISSAERKQALLSDEVVELKFRVNNLLDSYDLPFSIDGEITYDRTVRLDDCVYLKYGTATEEAVEGMEALVEAEATPHWQSVRFLHSEDGVTHFELRMVDPPLTSKVAPFGAYIHEETLLEGDYHSTVHLAPTVDVNRFVESVSNSYPQSQLVTRRQFTRKSDQGMNQMFEGSLTDRQKMVLEAAFFSGYFDWPRNTTGEEVAETLGLSPPTFHYHLRHAQQTILEAITNTIRATDNGT